jgi:hypothetical protein
VPGTSLSPSGDWDVPGTSSTENAAHLGEPAASDPALSLRGTAFRAAACTKRGQGGL